MENFHFFSKNLPMKTKESMEVDKEMDDLSDDFDDNEMDEGDLGPDGSEGEVSDENSATNKKYRGMLEIVDNERMMYLSKHRELLKPFIKPNVYEYLSKIKDRKFPTKSSIEVVQPKSLVSCKMRDYQIEGLTWLVKNYHSSMNCILGDEMGLGKTLQSISFVAHMLFEEKVKGPFLFVVPLSVLFVWMNEFRRWCPSIQVLRMHTSDAKEQLRLRKLMSRGQYQVVVTTYEMVKTGGLQNTFKRTIWRSVFCDEGHRLRHEQTAVAKACLRLKAMFKVILTGTPLHNNLHELGALLQFLAPNVFTDLSLFDPAFDLNTFGSSRRSSSSNNKDKATTAQNAQIDRELLEKAHYMSRIFVLRRIKSEVEQKLPAKLETKINCPMSAHQKQMVTDIFLAEQKLLERIQKKLTEDVHAATIVDDTAEGNDKQTAKAKKVRNELKKLESVLSSNAADTRKLFNLLMQLRKVANHPYLFPNVEKVGFDGLPTEEIVTISGKMVILDRLLRQLKAKGHRVVLFSQFTHTLDIICDYLDMRDHRYSRLDGSTNRVMREVLVTLFNRPNSEIFVFCLSTRAGGEGLNLHTADTVILFDSDWNPQVDMQAMARVHRIGQQKPVHVYRLVTSGSVEESIVARAQKKLFLDMMVNRGSTANALKLDELQRQETEQLKALNGKKRSLEPDNGIEGQSAKKKVKSNSGSSGKSEDHSLWSDAPLGPGTALFLGATLMTALESPAVKTKLKQQLESMGAGASAALLEEAEAEVDRDDNPAPSKIFSSLKFGWNSIFSPSNVDNVEITDADIELLIDRKRGLLSAVGGTSPKKSQEGKSPARAADKSSTSFRMNVVLAKDGNIIENQESSIDTFDEFAPLVSISNLRAKTLSLTSANPAANQSATSIPEMSVNSKADASGTENGEKGDTRPNSEATVDESLAAAIAEINAEEGGAAYRTLTQNRQKRVTSSRTVNVLVEGVGVVQMLRDDSNTLKPVKQQTDDANLLRLLQTKGSHRQVAGRDYHHQDHCQVCWDGGELLVCDMCPCAFHTDCIGLKTVPSGEWKCPHHVCSHCGRSSAQATLLFRCEMCTCAYCEDCLPGESVLVGESETFNAMGYRMPASCCYVHCSEECVEHFAMLGDDDKMVDGAKAGQAELTKAKSPGKGKKKAAVAKRTPKKKVPSAPKIVETETGTMIDLLSDEAEPDDDNEEEDYVSSDSDGSFIKRRRSTRSGGKGKTPPPKKKGGFKLPPEPAKPIITDPIELQMHNCSLPDIRERLKLDFSVPSARFTNLAEIPLFIFRYSEAVSRVQAQLLKIIYSISKKIAEIAGADKKSSDSSGTSAAATGTEETSVVELVHRYSGVPSKGLTFEQIADIFLHTVQLVAQTSKPDLISLSKMLGICNYGPMGKKAYEHEPRFSFVSSFPRQRHEELVAAFLVVPNPINLLVLPNDKESYLAAKPQSAECLITVTRLLQCLGEHLLNENNGQFVSFDLAEEASMHSYLAMWTPVRPLGKRSDEPTRMKWLLPAHRLLTDMKGLLQELLRLPDKLHTTVKNCVFHDRLDLLFPKVMQRPNFSIKNMSSKASNQSSSSKGSNAKKGSAPTSQDPEKEEPEDDATADGESDGDFEDNGSGSSSDEGDDEDEEVSPRSKKPIKRVNSTGTAPVLPASTALASLSTLSKLAAGPAQPPVMTAEMKAKLEEARLHEEMAKSQAPLPVPIPKIQEAVVLAQQGRRVQEIQVISSLDYQIASTIRVLHRDSKLLEAMIYSATVESLESRSIVPVNMIATNTPNVFQLQFLCSAPDLAAFQQAHQKKAQMLVMVTGNGKIPAVNPAAVPQLANVSAGMFVAPTASAGTVATVQPLHFAQERVVIPNPKPKPWQLVVTPSQRGVVMWMTHNYLKNNAKSLGIGSVEMLQTASQVYEIVLLAISPSLTEYLRVENFGHRFTNAVTFMRAAFAKK